MPARLVILHAPGHAPDISIQTILAAEETDADSIGYSEFYKVADTLPDRIAYDAVVAHSDVDTRAVRSPRGDAGDNPIAVRRDHEILRRRSYKADDPSQGTARQRKNGPERHVYVVDYRTDLGKICHINAHPSPLFVGPRKWHRVMKLVQHEVQKARARGCLVVVTGDLQTGIAAGRMLRAVGLKVWRVRIDFIAADAEQLWQRGWRTFRPEGMDHEWMLASFTLNGQP